MCIRDRDIRVVYQQKDSLAKKENPVAFSLGEEGLKWLGEYDISLSLIHILIIAILNAIRALRVHNL